MPVYEFKCSNCGVFEELVKTNINSRPCPKCKKKSGKLFSACSGFKLKGPGFYCNDYKNKK